MVSEGENEEITGFMIYELNRKDIHFINIAIRPDCQRQGIGTTMIQYLQNKLSAQRRNRIYLEIRETNLPAQYFFRENGFKAISVLRDFYENSIEDAYLMEFRVPIEKKYSYK